MGRNLQLPRFSPVPTQNRTAAFCSSDRVLMWLTVGVGPPGELAVEGGEGLGSPWRSVLRLRADCSSLVLLIVVFFSQR